MAKPGPAKGSGGRPRKKPGTNTAKAGNYVRRTVGAAGKGRQVLEHRAKLGLTSKASKGSSKVVDHKDANPSNNSRKNLRVTTRGKNAARGRRGK